MMNPRKQLLERLKLAAEENVPVVVLLRADGTADIKFPHYVSGNVAVVYDRGKPLVVPYYPDEVYRLPGRLPLLVATEVAPGGVTGEKVLWTQVVRSLLAGNGAVKEALAQVAAKRNARVIIPDGKAVPAAELIEEMQPEEVAELLAGRRGVLAPLDGKGLERLTNPMFYTQFLQRYYEIKLIDYMIKTMQLKLAYERGWGAILRKVAVLAVIAVAFLVMAWLLPQILRAFPGAKPVVVP